MIHIALCDDSWVDLEKNREYVSNWMHTQRIPFEIKIYENSGNLLLDIEDGVSFDLILCDIEMPKISGMEIAKTIKLNIPYCITIFITSYIKYAVDAFSLNVFRFIPKDELEIRLSEALQDALNMIAIQQEDYYVIEHANWIERIAYKDIIYIQKEKNYIVFYLKNKKTTRVRKSLKRLLDELGQENYELIHRDIAVNLLHVMKLASGEIHMIDDICLPISSSRQECLKVRIAEFWEKYL